MPKTWTRRVQTLLDIARPVGVAQFKRKRLAEFTRVTLGLFGVAGRLALLLNHEQTGRTLMAAWRERGWQGIVRLIAKWIAKTPNETNVTTLIFAGQEAPFFHRGRCVILWCQHGKHYFISAHRRRKDCIIHAPAGQRSRTRMKAKQAKRTRAIAEA